jgi:hypothetical protein
VSLPVDAIRQAIVTRGDALARIPGAISMHPGFRIRTDVEGLTGTRPADLAKQLHHDKVRRIAPDSEQTLY